MKPMESPCPSLCPPSIRRRSLPPRISKSSSANPHPPSDPLRHRRSQLLTNHDEETNQQEILVRLGVHVSQLEPDSVTNIGLASIENDETNFLFAVNSRSRA